MMKKFFLLLILVAAASAQTNPPNIGPITTTLNDDIGTATPPANPTAGRCRRYFNSVTGLETWINSSGANCGPSGGGGGGSPGGANTQFQYNLLGGFGGSPGLTYNNATNPPEVDVQSFANEQYVQPSYNWAQQPGGTLTGGTPATVTLTPCPYGVNGVLDTIGNAYISGGTGTAEVVYYTGGGTCTSGAASGTVKFTPLNNHSGSWQIGSASSGIYEALSGITNWGHPSGNVHLHLRPAGFPTGATGGNFAYAYDVWGTIQTPTNNIYVDGQSAVVNCHTRDYCWASSAALGPVHITGLRFATDADISGWTIVSTQCASNTTTITTGSTHGIQVNDVVDVQWTDNHHYWGGSVSQLSKVTAVTATTVSYTDTNCGGAGSIALANSPGEINTVTAFFLAANNGDELLDILESNPGGISGHFNNGVVVLNDQAFKMDGATINMSGGTPATGQCTLANPYCGWGVYAPGPFVNAAVIWLTNDNLSLNCNGNGVGYFSGNTLSIRNSVIQGFPEIGVLTGNARGGFGRTHIDDLYEEQGCADPKYNPVLNAGMGIETIGAPTYYDSGEGPQGGIPLFSSGGATEYFYYEIVHDSVLGASAPFLIGAAEPTGTTVPVQFIRVPGTNTITYDFLRVAIFSTLFSPTTANCVGGSTTACGSVATAVAQCATLICSFTDTVTNNTTAYTVTDPPQYVPFMWFLPGPFVSQVSGVDTSVGPTSVDCGGAFHIFGMTIGIGLASNAGADMPCVFTDYAPGGGSGLTQGWFTALESNAHMPTLMNMNAFTASNKKGRLMFMRHAGTTVPAGDIIDLVDHSPAATFGDGNYNPATDPLSMYIGNDIDGASLGGTGMSLNAPVQITQYIDGVKEVRVNSSKTEFSSPTQFDQIITPLGGCNGCSPFSLIGVQESGFVNANFTQVNGTSTLNGTTITATTLGTGSEIQTVYTNTTNAANQFAQAQMVGRSTGVMGLMVRASNSARTGYIFEENGGSGSAILKEVAGALTVLGTGFAVISPGDIMQETVYTSYSGSTPTSVICGYQNGVQLACVTDSTSPLLSGQPGIYFANNPTGLIFGSWQAGDYTYGITAGLTISNLLSLSNPLMFDFTPAVSSGFNSGTVTFNNGTFEIVITIGSGAASSAGVLALPTAKNGWHCSGENTSRYDVILPSTGWTTTSATLVNWGASGTLTNWTNGDVIMARCGSF